MSTSANIHPAPSKHSPLAQRRVILGSAIALFCWACDPQSGDDCPPDMPSGWECATSRSLTQAPPNCSDAADDPTAAVSVIDGVASLHVEGMTFREEQSAICAWSIQNGSEMMVLLQPCDMHPDEDGLKGFCYHDFDVDLGSVIDIESVSVFARYDFFGYDPPDAPIVREHATAEVP